MTRPASDGYVRPDLRVYSFVAGDGRVVEYGSRFNAVDSQPAEGDYVTMSATERFDQLTDVAESVIAHLAENFDVTVTEEADPPAIQPYGAPNRRVTLTPRDEQAAPLGFDFQNPGLVVRCGLLHDVGIPTCMCDACDESSITEAERVEDLAFAIADGHYRESVDGRLRMRISHVFDVPGRWGQSGTESALQDFRRDRARAVRGRLDQMCGTWHPWPRRV